MRHALIPLGLGFEIKRKKNIGHVQKSQDIDS